MIAMTAFKLLGVQIRGGRLRVELRRPMRSPARGTPRPLASVWWGRSGGVGTFRSSDICSSQAVNLCNLGSICRRSRQVCRSFRTLADPLAFEPARRCGLVAGHDALHRRRSLPGRCAGRRRVRRVVAHAGLPASWPVPTKRSDGSRHARPTAAMSRTRSAMAATISTALPSARAARMCWCAARTKQATSAGSCKGRRISTIFSGSGADGLLSPRWGDVSPAELWPGKSTPVGQRVGLGECGP